MECRSASCSIPPTGAAKCDGDIHLWRVSAVERNGYLSVCGVYMAGSPKGLFSAGRKIWKPRDVFVGAGTCSGRTSYVRRGDREVGAYKTSAPSAQRCAVTPAVHCVG